MPSTEPPNIRYGSNLQVNFTEIGSCAALFLLIGGLLATVKRFGWGKTVVFFFFSTNILVEASTNLNDVEFGSSSVPLLDYKRFIFNAIRTCVAVFLILLAVKWNGSCSVGIYLITNVVLMMDIILVMLSFVAVVNILPYMQSLLAALSVDLNKIPKNKYTDWINLIGFDKLGIYSGTSLPDIFGYLYTWFNLIGTWNLVAITLSLLSLQLLYCNLIWKRTKIWCRRIKYDFENLVRTQSRRNLSNLIWDLLQISIIFDFILSGQSIFDLQEKWKFENFLCSMKSTYEPLCIQNDAGKPVKTPITRDMYDNTPTLVETNFKDLNTKTVTGGQTRITHNFPVDMEDAGKRLFAIIGEPGSGKSVYLETLRSYYIKQGLFPFRVTFRSLAFMKNRKEMNFLQFLCKCAGVGFKFHDAKKFVTWIRRNKRKIIILADGLDEHPSLIKENISPLRSEEMATADTWLSLLFYGKIHELEGLKIVFTSRPSSIHNLPQYSRPDVYYSMNGFADESLPSVLRRYCKASVDVDEILKFINSKGASFKKLARNPFMLALVALTYKNTTQPITSDTKLTQFFEIVFKQLRCSPRSRLIENWNVETDESLDKFFYGVFKKVKMEFTEQDIYDYNDADRKEHCRKDKQRSDERDLTLEKVECYSLMKVRTDDTPARIDAREEIIEPAHNNVVDFHIARYLISQIDFTEFKTLVQTEMFSGKEEDRWVMIRRFISGLINRTEVNTDKSRIFNMQYVKTLNESISQDPELLRHRFGENKLNQARILQGHLYNDLLEFNDEQLSSIKEKFTGKSGHLFVVMNDDTCIKGPTYFLRKVKPHLEQLFIDDIGDVEPTDFIHFTEAVEDLPKKVDQIIIGNISPFHGHVEAIGRIFTNTETSLVLRYCDQVKHDDFEYIKKQLQAQIDKLKSTNADVSLQHRGRFHLIRHPSSGNVEFFKYNRTSDIFKTSIFYTGLSSNIGNETYFSFILSTNPQLKKLHEILNEFRSIHVFKIILFIPPDVEWNHIHSLIENIKNMETKVGISICNLLLSEVDIDEALSLIPKVSKILELFYVDELSNDEKVEIWNKLPPASSGFFRRFFPPASSESNVIIIFNNFRVERIGDQWKKTNYRNR